MTSRQLMIGALSAAVLGTAGAPALARGGDHELTLTTTALERLSGARYEVWVVKGPRKFSAGTFNFTGNGRQTRTRFHSPVSPATADAIAVTVEPRDDPSPAPSRVVVLMGTPTAMGGAALRFPVDLSGAAGSFILATPTDGPMTNETAGLWFLDPAAGPGPGLSLPPLPRGWTYEGWGVTQGTALSTGKFSSPTGADRAAPFSGPQAGPPFPGEDFLTGLPSTIRPPVNLADGASRAVISIEPDLGAGVDPSGPAPFSIKPLVASIAAGQADHASIRLTANPSSLPMGTVNVHRHAHR